MYTIKHNKNTDKQFATSLMYFFVKGDNLNKSNDQIDTFKMFHVMPTNLSELNFSVAYHIHNNCFT